jgi:protein O-GlcNAc transferase
MTIQQALQLHHAGRLAEAEALYRRVLAGEPQNVHALHFLGVLRAQLGDFEGSVKFLQQAVANGRSPHLYFHLAESLRLAERHDEALEAYGRSLEVEPDFTEASMARARCLGEAGRWQESLEACDRLAAGNAAVELAFLRGRALLGLGRFAEALAVFDRVPPALADVQLSRGAALAGLGRLSEALATAEAELARQPSSADAHCLRAGVLVELGRLEEGLAAYQQALACKPGYVEAYYNLGNTLLELDRAEAALAAYDSALTVRPGHVPSLYNRTLALEQLGRGAEAAAGCDQALALDPGFGLAATKGFLIRAKKCDWHDHAKRYEALARLSAKNRRLDPFTLLAAFDDPGMHLQAATIMAGMPRAAAPHGAARQRLRIAYLSPDFHPHPVAYQGVDLFEQHDRTRFESFGICLAPGKETPIRRRLRGAFDHFVEAGLLNDFQLAQVLRAEGIDIAVDLAGYTIKGRTRMLAYRPAPLAVNYLGYPGTLGAPYIDYIMADKVLIPEGDEPFYAEKVVRLPHSYMPGDSKAAGDLPAPSRAEAGLPETGFVFCAFNSVHKFTPELFGVWMRLLTDVAGSVLWLNTQNKEAQANLCREAAARGVAPERLIFAARIEERAQHLARLPLAGLFLDTLPYGAHSTANDMLRAGVPVLTCRGRSFASRVAASMLEVLCLPELIAADLRAYETRALQLARNPAALEALRKELIRARAGNPLFDTAKLCRALETAYRTMWDIHLQGRKPESFSVNIAS